MDMFGWMLFVALLWAWFDPEEMGEWAGKIANGFRETYRP